MSFLKFKNRFLGTSSQKQKERVKEAVQESDISGFLQEFALSQNQKQDQSSPDPIFIVQPQNASKEGVCMLD